MTSTLKPDNKMRYYRASCFLQGTDECPKATQCRAVSKSPSAVAPARSPECQGEQSPVDETMLQGWWSSLGSCRH